MADYYSRAFGKFLIGGLIVLIILFLIEFFAERGKASVGGILLMGGVIVFVVVGIIGQIIVSILDKFDQRK